MHIKNFLEKIEWKIALKTALAGSVSLFLSLAINTYFKRPDYIISGLWAALAAIVVQQAHLGSTYKSAWLRFLGVLVGSLMGGLFTTLLGSNPISLAVAIFLTIVICSLFQIKESLRIACLSVAVVMILWGLRPAINPWVFGFYRFLDSCLGISVAVVIAHLIWPLQVSRKLSNHVADILDFVRTGYSFSTSLKRREPEVPAVLRKANELIWKSRQLLEDSKLELLTMYDNLEEWKFLFNHLDILVDKVRVLNKTHKENLEELMGGEALSFQLEEHKLVISNYLQSVSKAFIMSLPSPDEAELTQSLRNLNAGLGEFRKTKKTSQFKLEDVEGFFVFFYTLRAFADELFKVRKHMDAILLKK
jgi:uncharacterized membrane protein YccC